MSIVRTTALSKICTHLWVLKAVNSNMYLYSSNNPKWDLKNRCKSHFYSLSPDNALLPISLHKTIRSSLLWRNHCLNNIFKFESDDVFSLSCTFKSVRLTLPAVRLRRLVCIHVCRHTHCATDTAAPSLLFAGFKHKEKVLQAAMIYLFCTKIHKALPGTEPCSRWRCTVRAARQHKGAPGLELVRNGFSVLQNSQRFLLSFVVAILNQGKKAAFLHIFTCCGSTGEQMFLVWSIGACHSYVKGTHETKSILQLHISALEM